MAPLIAVDGSLMAFDGPLIAVDGSLMAFDGPLMASECPPDGQ
jgi:ABC-type Fe2+-enterobactin transport system substrate-binding protein